MSSTRHGWIFLGVALLCCSGCTDRGGGIGSPATAVAPVPDLQPLRESFVDSGEAAIDLPVHWQIGDKVSYEILRTRDRTQAEQPPMRTGAATDLEIEVLAQNAQGFVLGWTLGETRLSGGVLGAADLLQNAAQLMSGVQLQLQLDETSSVASITNWRELQQKGSIIAEQMTRQLRASNVDDATITQSRATLQNMLSSEVSITALFGREAQVYFMAVGGSFAKEPTVYEDQLPNAFGGEPFPSVASFQLKYVDQQAKRACVTWEQHLDKAATNRIMKQIVGQLTGDARQAQKMLNFAVNDKAEFVLDLNTGWLHHLYHNRYADMGVGSQIDTIVFRRK
jgi:hypothetical protein